MSRLIEVKCIVADNDDAAKSGKLLVEEHLIVVSYVIPVKVFFRENNQIVTQNRTMLLLKSKDVVFKNKLNARLKELSCQETAVVPIVDVVPDWRAWVEKEVYE